MKIADRIIGRGDLPYVIAEIASEHCGSYERAIRLIEVAKEAGADAAKLQLYDPLKLAEARGGADYVLPDGLWAGRTLLDLYTQAHTPRKWFPGLFAAAKSIGITLFSSVFDEEGVDYLETLECPAYKISSFEIRDLALIRKTASTGKPLIISTGMASDDEVEDAYIAAMTPDVAWLHCVSAYPCDIREANLSRIDVLVHWLQTIGLSDHTLGSVAPIVATALGASIIEKHLTLSRADGGPDAAFSLEPAEFKQMVSDVRDAYASLGTGERSKSEDTYRPLRAKVSA